MEDTEKNILVLSENITEAKVFAEAKQLVHQDLFEIFSRPFPGPGPDSVTDFFSFAGFP